MTLREMMTTKEAYLGGAEEAGLVTRRVPMLELDDEGIMMEAFQYGVFDVDQTSREEAVRQVKKVRKQIEEEKLSKKFDRHTVCLTKTPSGPG